MAPEEDIVTIEGIRLRLSLEMGVYDEDRQANPVEWQDEHKWKGILLHLVTERPCDLGEDALVTFWIRALDDGDHCASPDLLLVYSPVLVFPRSLLPLFSPYHSWTSVPLYHPSLGCYA